MPKMTTKTAASTATLHALYAGKTLRKSSYDVLRKVEGFPTAQTLKSHDLIIETTLEWGYSEGEENGTPSIFYAAITIK